MREIAKTFSNLRNCNEKALIAYVTAGDPEPNMTSEIVETLVKGGADIIELGIPFSDPIADGPTIQAASIRSLRAGTNPRLVLKIADEINEFTNVPIVLLTYFNIIFRMGLKTFFKTASLSGVNGVIVPDLPVEEATKYKKIAESYEIDTIFLIAPSTSPKRTARIARSTSGFLYLVTVYGVTGVRDKIQISVKNQIHRTRKIIQDIGLPLAVGFGVSKPQHIRTIVENGADGAIVGSGFVKIIETKHKHKAEMLKALEKYSFELKQATKMTM